ncbi:hypothetical protein KRR39_05800 [Nocardioides panacis]|uniref:Peptidase M12B domain-containing protein n=1 Tax=Nocardioides panacis TaxID=2849501 RepID=A0A975T0C7_9ACTN|nr:hypothetical protein [Nocardioides panacis]QWZ09298.1 hypothetical protein KRR39_05800 [Nocardioides panacis]
MRIRAVARLVVVSLAAAGALVLVHPAVADSENGGPVSVAGASGTLAHPGELGPVHIDPVPHDVSLSDPVDTVSLLEKAGVVGARLAAADQPMTVGATAPLGTPGISSLGSHVTPSCTSSDADRVQVLYVHEATTTSRYTQVLPLIRNEVANVDDVFAVSAEQTGGGRRVRWVHTADCLPVVLDVAVPAGALGPDFWDTIDALQAQGYDRADRKYMVFADTNQFCGIGTVYDDDRLVGNLNDGRAASYARIDANCWSSGHSVPAHELTHNLGGVLPGAPHATANGHCWDESDLLCYDDGSGVPMQRVCPSSQEQLLDCNHDDYFSTDPVPGSYLATRWNTASSSFLDTVPGPVVAPSVPAPSAPAPAVPDAPRVPTPASPVPVGTAWSVPTVSRDTVHATLLAAGAPPAGHERPPPGPVGRQHPVGRGAAADDRQPWYGECARVVRHRRGGAVRPRRRRRAQRLGVRGRAGQGVHPGLRHRRASPGRGHAAHRRGPGDRPRRPRPPATGPGQRPVVRRGAAADRRPRSGGATSRPHPRDHLPVGVRRRGAARAGREPGAPGPALKVRG